VGASDWSRPIGIVDREMLPEISLFSLTVVIKGAEIA
jgi:hypothetical protein